MLNIDTIIEQRFPQILQQPSLLRRPLVAGLKMLFHEREQRNFQQRYPHLHGIDFVDQLLPVNNMDGKTSRDQIKAVYRHLEAEGVAIIFPAGAVSRLSPAGIRDGRWSSGFLRIAG